MVSKFGCGLAVAMRAKLKDTGQRVFKAPGKLWKHVVNNSQRFKRIVKVSTALTLAIGITVPTPFADFYGENFVLLGTIAIYLFPIKTVGGHIYAALVGLSGVLLGLAYANFSLWIASLVQNDNDEYPSASRRVLLWCALAVGAIGCGYVRSKIARSYLAINFFMVVNMFALIRGIDHIDYVFHAFFYVMFLGAAVSTLVCLVLWPEDRGGMLKKDVAAGISEARILVDKIRLAMKNGVREEIDHKKLMKAEAALGGGLHEANYEICFSRVDPNYLVAIHSCLSRIVSICRVFDASMRRMQRPESAGPSDRTVNSIQTRLCMDGVFNIALGLLDAMGTKLEELHRGKLLTPLDYEKLGDRIEEMCGYINTDVRTRLIAEYRDLEDATFTDQINTTIVDIFDVVKDMAQAIAIIEPGSFPLILPRKLRRNKIESGQALERSLNGRRQSINNASDATLLRNSIMSNDEWYLLSLEPVTPTAKACIWLSARLVELRNSRHIKYAIKFMVVMGILALPAFISNWYLWYEGIRGQLAMISAMVAMETTRGMTLRTALMKLLGAVSGGVLAFVVMEISRGFVWPSIVLTAVVGLLIGWLVTHPTFAKSGTVCALAYNLVLGVATVDPEKGPVESVLVRRIGTLPVGLAVALFVHLTLFPYRSRQELVKALSSALDWIHHLLFAIEAGEEHPQLHFQLGATVQKAVDRVALAKSLLPATHYEFSLNGHWPYDRFETIVGKITDVMMVIVGEQPKDPLLAVHLDGIVEGDHMRAKLLASLCNDLLVISHSLSAQLFMPRHGSTSSILLREYLSLLLQDALDPYVTSRSYCDVGRLADLVSEIAFLRTEVDQLTTAAHRSRNGLLHTASQILRRSRPGTPVTPRERSRDGTIVDEELGVREDERV